MDLALYLLAIALIVGGLIGAVLPMLPGIPAIFGGVWLAAAVDGYHRLGTGWLLSIAAVGCLGVAMDFIAGSLGAKRIGASQRALWGASIGTVVGMFFSLPGLILGPFVGALLGELSSGNSVLRSTHVGISTWIGLIFGTLIKIAVSLMMVAMAAFGWWLS